MAEIPGELAVHRCPRCGGLMTKPAGSPFYWHADNNHPRCDITNIVDPPLVAQTSEQLPPPTQPFKGKRQKRNS